MLAVVMARVHGMGLVLLMAWAMPGCVQPVPPSTGVLPGGTPGGFARAIRDERASAVLVATRDSIRNLADSRLAGKRTGRDVDGGSAAPISADGYFLTADHVLARLGGGRVPMVIYGLGREPQAAPARVVWRSASGDLALLHAPLSTPWYYEWTPPDQWLADGTGVIHGGIATGPRSAPGKLMGALPPESRFTGSRKFKIDIPLQPGDSGGPVLDARGLLVGVNSAVVFLVPMDTAFFVDSECFRPSLRKLAEIMRRDRARKKS